MEHLWLWCIRLLRMFLKRRTFEISYNFAFSFIIFSPPFIFGSPADVGGGIAITEVGEQSHVWARPRDAVVQILQHPAPLLPQLPGTADSSSRNADTIPVRLAGGCFGFWFFFCSFATYRERPEAQPRLVNPRCCQDPEGFLPSVKLSHQMPSNTSLIG